MELSFECPRCWCNTLIEHVSNVEMTYEVIVSADGDMDYGDSDIEGGVVDGYICSGCGFIVPIDYGKPTWDRQIELRNWLLTLPCNQEKILENL